jgi:hypothetical protein
MCVDEPGKKQPTPEVDDLGVRTSQGQDLALAADGDDALALGGEGLRLGSRGVDGPDAAAAEDEVGYRDIFRRAFSPAR